MDKNVENLEYEIIDEKKKKVKIHALYLAIIFILLSIFLILVAPSQVCPRAFDNFAFASTIVSIVLAAVSIVFSFRIGKSSGDNIAGIREIERGIEDKLKKFDSIKTDIEEAIVRNTKPITDEVGSIRRDQESMKELFDKVVSGGSLEHKQKGNSQKRSPKSQPTPLMGAVTMLLCALAFENKKTVVFNELSEPLKNNSLYVIGYVSSLRIMCPEDIDASLDVNTITVKKYNNDMMGTPQEWTDRISQSKNKFAKTFLENIDAYFAS